MLAGVIRQHSWHTCMQIISKVAEEDSPVKPTAVVAAGYDMDSLGADDLEYNYDKPGLAALRRRLAAAIHDFKGAHAQYEDVIRQVSLLQLQHSCTGNVQLYAASQLRTIGSGDLCSGKSMHAAGSLHGSLKGLNAACILMLV